MKLNILFCGLGSIGLRHARLLERHFNHELYAFRTHQGQAPVDLRITEFKDWNEVKKHRFDVAFITNPTNLHIESAARCADLGMNLFIEKPIDCTTKGLDKLLSVVNDRGLSTYVAYPFRHHPLMITLKQLVESKTVLHSHMVCASYMPTWRSKQHHLFNYTAFKNQGGGIVLDVSHEIDSTVFLFGDITYIEGVYAKRGSVTRDSEDCADLLVSHTQGTTNIHMNYVSQHTQRFVEVDTDRFHVRADFVANTLTRTDAKGQSVQKFEIDRDLMYLNQLQYFFDHLGDTNMTNCLTQAESTFQKIIEFKRQHENTQRSTKVQSAI